MKINRDDVLTGITLYNQGEENYYLEWCREVLPVILSSLIEIPGDKYSIWEMPENPKGYPNTEELDRLLAFNEESDTLTRFIDWLVYEDISLCKRTETEVEEGVDKDKFWPIHMSFETLFFLFFEIDQGKLEKERGEILEYMKGKYFDSSSPSCALHVTVEGEEEDIEVL